MVLAFNPLVKLLVQRDYLGFELSDKVLGVGWQPSFFFYFTELKLSLALLVEAAERYEPREARGGVRE